MLTALSLLAVATTGCARIESGLGPPMGRLTEAGHVELAGAAFALDIPAGWVVHISDPDPDLLGQPAGAAWVAVRANDPDGRTACSIAVGIAEVSLAEGSGTSAASVVTPAWDPRHPTQLMVPMPSVPDGDTTWMTAWVRPSDETAGLGHDVLYSLMCSERRGVMTREQLLDRTAGPFDELVDSFELLEVTTAAASAPR